jgi:integrase
MTAALPIPTIPAAAPVLLTRLDQLAAIPEEEIWLAKQKSARTRRAYRLDVRHFKRARRRALAAGIMAPIGNHSFRATSITAYLANGGTLEHAQAMAAHESPRTTKPYDRNKKS